MNAPHPDGSQTAKALMIQGCTSNAGKSYLAAAFCRHYANAGLRVAPFKAQNMSNNAGVTPEGLEMGRAQLLQAQAARVTPEVRMNPVLLKPEADTRSQVVLLGQARHDLTEIPWGERKPYLWQTVQKSLHSLLRDHDLLVIEGAGSPAEINLKAGDIVNMRVAKEARARVLLAVDIDKGGAFAHLLGTWHTLDDDEKRLLTGFVLNKFRGDPALLGDAGGWLEQQTGVPTLGTVPMLRLPLPEEDAFSLNPKTASLDKPVVAVILTPYISNFDEFDPLLHEDGMTLRFVKTLSDLDGVAAVILPGSKHVPADLDYLRRTGIAARVHALAARDVPVLGICGGLQMLGSQVHDPHGVEGGETTRGLGLLALETTLESRKTTRLGRATLLLEGVEVTGYEIHHGQTQAANCAPYLSDDLGFRQGAVAGVYLHGLFENAAFRYAFLQQIGVSASSVTWGEQVDASLDTLAAHVAGHCDMAAIDAALGIG